jgi:hypothetical protein
VADLAMANPPAPIPDTLVRSSPTERAQSDIDLTAPSVPVPPPSKQDDEKATLAKFLLENLT